MILKLIAFVVATLAFAGSFWFRKVSIERPENAKTAVQTFYDFKATPLDGGTEIDMAKYRGHKVVIINVASKCGNTPQYEAIQKFHEAHGKDIIVLGFPANDFGAQEPGSNGEIAEFCKKNYGVTFQMFDKITVKGENKHPLYKWLSTKELNGWNDKEPTWNFCKYVVNEKGELTNFFGGKVLVTDEPFLKAVGL